MKSLQRVLTEIIQNVDVQKLNKRVIAYKDFKNKYVILKPSVEVKIELTEGKVVTVDVTDFFEGVVK